MKLQVIGKSIAVAGLLVFMSAGSEAMAQTKRCGHEHNCGHEHKSSHSEACEGSCVKVHAHGPMIFRNTRYNDSYKKRYFSHQRSAYKNSWERRHYR